MLVLHVTNSKLNYCILVCCKSLINLNWLSNIKSLCWNRPMPDHCMVLTDLLRVSGWGVSLLTMRVVVKCCENFVMQYSYSIEITLFHLKIENLDPRGIQLSALFMSGVDMALFANDACGQPVPWEHCCPWMYFDGKLFQSKLLKASREKTPLIDLCDGQVSCKNAGLEMGRNSWPPLTRGKYHSLANWSSFIPNL